MMTVSDMVSLETPPKNDAAPISARAPGSIQAQNFSWGIPPCTSTSKRPSARPYKPPMYLQHEDCIKSLPKMRGKAIMIAVL